MIAMPKYVAIDVGASQVRYLLAEVARKRIQVLGYGAFDVHEQSEEELAPADESSAPGSEQKTKGPLISGCHAEMLGERLAAELAKAGGSGARAIVAVGRADVEIRRFTLPPASDDELAELVAVQALSEAGAGGDTATVDYVPQPVADNGGRPVEAVLADAKMLEAYQAFANSSGIKLRRMVLRPYASASLLGYFQDQENPEFPGSETTLLVDRIAAEVDLIATRDSQVLLWRTIQLDDAASGSSAAQGLTAEIVRTLAIAPAHMPAGQRIERIQLWGAEAEHASLAAELAQETNLRVEILDPASLAEVSAAGQLDCRHESLNAGENLSDEEGLNSRSDLSDKAAPMLAMLLAEATATAPAIDLLNPHKPPLPRNNKRVALLAILAGAVLCYLVGTWLQDMHAELDRANTALANKMSEYRKQAKKLAPQLALARSIAAWEAAGIVWLDELRDLTGKFPSAEDVTVRGMTISSLRGGGAMIRVTGQAKDPAIIVKMDHDLRDAYRDATSTNFREQGTKGERVWRFETVITTRRRSAKDYLAKRVAAKGDGS